MLREDCSFLEYLQQTFKNVKFILCDDDKPYLHLFKNVDEAFDLDFDLASEMLLESEYHDAMDLNTDEKVSILLKSIESYFIDKECDEQKKYILFYGGTGVRKTFMNVNNVQEVYYDLVNYFKILEIK